MLLRLIMQNITAALAAESRSDCRIRKVFMCCSAFALPHTPEAQIVAAYGTQSDSCAHHNNSPTHHMFHETLICE